MEKVPAGGPGHTQVTEQVGTLGCGHDAAAVHASARPHRAVPTRPVGEILECHPGHIPPLRHTPGGPLLSPPYHS